MSKTTKVKKLNEAAQYGDVQLVTKLLDAGVDVNATNDIGWTALHFASRDGCTDVVRLLLVRGANVNAVACHKWRPLRLASINGHTEVVLVLLQHGANVNAVDDDGRKAIDVCPVDNQELKDLLMGVSQATKAAKTRR